MQLFEILQNLDMLETPADIHASTASFGDFGERGSEGGRAHGPAPPSARTPCARAVPDVDASFGKAMNLVTNTHSKPATPNPSCGRRPGLSMWSNVDEILGRQCMSG